MKNCVWLDSIVGVNFAQSKLMYVALLFRAIASYSFLTAQHVRWGMGELKDARDEAVGALAAVTIGSAVGMVDAVVTAANEYSNGSSPQEIYEAAADAWIDRTDQVYEYVKDNADVITQAASITYGLTSGSGGN